MDRLRKEPSLSEITQAHEAIRPFIHETPIFRNQTINDLTKADIYFKCENMQKVGAFKMRGASCAVAALSSREKKKGIATHSSGNHAQAVALSAKLNQIPAYIVMPENAPRIKRDAVEDYGAKIYTSGARISDREQMMKKVLADTQATFIHPYDDYNIIAGQGTAAKEIFAKVEHLDIIMAPIGGGGLMSGTALFTKQYNADVRVIGTEPSIVDDAYRSFHSGKIETNDRIDTIADGLRTQLSDKTFSIIRTYVDTILTVTEAGIVEAMRLLWERMKVVVEPSGAVPLAAILEHPELFIGQKIALIISGGNVDLQKLPF